MPIFFLLFMLFIKSLHIIAVVAWFAALLYLPRLFVYHLQALEEEDTRGAERFKRMEKRLYRTIMTPSAMATVFLGIMLLGFRHGYYLYAPWMWLKLLLVVVLLAFHIRCGRYMRQLAADRPVPSQKYFRWFNEFPVLVLVVIVLLVELQPTLRFL